MLASRPARVTIRLANWNVICLVGVEMKTSLRPSLAITAGFLVTTAVVQAHPGHDGHDLTWDFSADHLTGHPLATLFCSLILVAVAWGVAWLSNAGSIRLEGAVRREDTDRRR